MNSTIKIGLILMSILLTGVMLVSACTTVRRTQTSGACEYPCEPAKAEPVETPLPRYTVDVPYWVPMIDDCMAAGRTRRECFDALPEDVLADVAAWERAREDERRELLRRHQALKQPEAKQPE